MSTSGTERAWVLVDLERYAEALAECRRLLIVEPEHQDALRLAGYCALRLKNLPLAEEFANKLVAAHPTNAYGYSLKGDIENHRTSKGAEKFYREALRHAPEDSYYYRQLARFLDRWHREREAIAVAEQGLAHDAENMETLHLLSRLHRLHGDSAKAEAYGRRALAADPERASAHFEAGLRKLARGEPEWATEDFRRSLSLDPTDKAVRKLLTTTTFENEIRLMPFNRRVWLVLGGAYVVLMIVRALFVGLHSDALDLVLALLSVLVTGVTGLMIVLYMASVWRRLRRRARKDKF
ncbi:MAG TPA: tetratricopeptide repeat protein [Stellaceae bacterium]|nr:tetratricopeptide repeat protein [Stellaceae bacterium]